MEWKFQQAVTISETCAEHQINFEYKARRQGLNNPDWLCLTSRKLTT